MPVFVTYEQMRMAPGNVQFVSAAEALLLVLVSVFQIMYLRSLFAEKPNRF